MDVRLGTRLSRPLPPAEPVGGLAHHGGRQVAGLGQGGTLCARGEEPAHRRDGGRDVRRPDVGKRPGTQPLAPGHQGWRPGEIHPRGDTLIEDRLEDGPVRAVAGSRQQRPGADLRGDEPPAGLSVPEVAGGDRLFQRAFDRLAGAGLPQAEDLAPSEEIRVRRLDARRGSRRTERREPPRGRALPRVENRRRGGRSRDGGVAVEPEERQQDAGGLPHRSPRFRWVLPWHLVPEEVPETGLADELLALARGQAVGGGAHPVRKLRVVPLDGTDHRVDMLGGHCFHRPGPRPRWQRGPRPR